VHLAQKKEEKGEERGGVNWLEGRIYDDEASVQKYMCNISKNETVVILSGVWRSSQMK
jgi:hypothetical protein